MCPMWPLRQQLWVWETGEERQWGEETVESVCPHCPRSRASRGGAGLWLSVLSGWLAVTWECCGGTGCSYLLCHAGGRSQGGTATESPALPGAPPGVVLLQAAQCKTQPEGSSELIANILQKSYFLVITLIWFSVFSFVWSCYEPSCLILCPLSWEQGKRSHSTCTVLAVFGLSGSVAVSRCYSVQPTRDVSFWKNDWSWACSFEAFETTELFQIVMSEQFVELGCRYCLPVHVSSDSWN